MTVTARRFYLSFAVKLMFLAGVLTLAGVFLASVGSGDSVGETTADPWRLEMDWSRFSPGEYRTLTWPNGRQVGVYRRRDGEAEQLAARAAGELHDPGSRQSRQPAGLNPAWRSRHPDVFVFIAHETRRGCRVRLDKSAGEFVEPCYGARFDTAGRRLRGTGEAGQQNLAVPDYRLVGEQRLQLLPPEARS